MLKEECIMRINMDYGAVSNHTQSNTRAYNREIQSYFDPSDSESRSDLANASGAVYLKELSDFITSALYPMDGSWLEAAVMPTDEDKTRLALAKVSMYLRNAIAKSNFYGKMNELINHGLLYNKGLMSVEYTKGLNFTVYDPNKIDMSQDSDEWSTRIYSSQWVTAMDIAAKFTNVPEVVAEDIRVGYMGRQYEILHALVPNIPTFTEGLDIDKEAKFVPLQFLRHYQEIPAGKDQTETTGSFNLTLMMPHGGYAQSGYSVCPILKYQTGQKESLCMRALRDAVIVDSYEKIMLERAELVNYPPMALPVGLENRGGYSLGPKGKVPLGQNEQPPTPVQTSLQLNVSEHTVARKEARLREIFRIDLVKQYMATGVTQYEQHGMKYNALKAIQPWVCMLTGKTTEAIVGRVHNLLKQEDSKYKELLLALPENTQGLFYFDNLKRLMETSRKLSGMGQAAQAMQAFISVNPQAAQVIDTERAVKEALLYNGLVELIRPQGEVLAERQAFAQQAQQQQTQENQVEAQKSAAPLLEAQAAMKTAEAKTGEAGEQ